MHHVKLTTIIETSFYRRLRQIDDTISTQGIDLLLELFLSNMAKGNPSQYSTGKLIPYKDIHINPENLITLDAQFCEDENFAFFARQPGTLIILSRSMHASQQFGVTAHLNHLDTSIRAVSLLISETRSETIEEAPSTVVTLTTGFKYPTL